ncbi:MAG: ribonuclease Z, partial [Clostridia bacterium]|nr:ribonuclease Z [Clostridia bacterium]
MIDITLLGTAALLPIPERALTAAFLSCSGRGILFDCGEGTQTAARRAGVSLMKTDIIALTHYHGDHILGLPGLLQTMTSLERTEKLYLTGPAGLKAAMAPILQLTGGTSFEIDLIELPDSGILLSTLERHWPSEARLMPFKTEHRVPSQGYVFILDRPGRFLPEQALKLGIPQMYWRVLQSGRPVEYEGKTWYPGQVLGAPRKGLKFVFSGDTAYCDSLVRAASHADLMICEATYAENEQTELAEERGHMTFAQAAKAAKNADVQQLWLSHYSQRIEVPEDYLPNA